MKKKVVHQEGKVIETTEHEDGRKGVTVHVNTLNIDETDPESVKAKEVIEEKVLPKVAQQRVQAIVLHKPSNMHTTQRVKLPEVRKYAEVAIKQFHEFIATDPAMEKWRGTTRHADFTILEVYPDGMVRTSTL